MWVAEEVCVSGEERVQNEWVVYGLYKGKAEGFHL